MKIDEERGNGGYMKYIILLALCLTSILGYARKDEWAGWYYKSKHTGNCDYTNDPIAPFRVQGEMAAQYYNISHDYRDCKKLPETDGVVIIICYHPRVLTYFTETLEKCRELSGQDKPILKGKGSGLGSFINNKGGCK